jgi:DNA-binding response OmpR family regulator
VDPAIFGRDRPCHVLIVNLGVSKKQQFKQWAKAYGFKITVVTTIRDALTTASRLESKVDVMLADISEGASNVLDMMRQLRASHACIPVMIAIPPASDIHADAAMAEALAECHKLGIAAALEKPLAFEQLAVRARVVLERSKKVDEIYNDVRIAKTQKDNSRHKSEHRKAFVEEQYQGTVASRPVSRTARTSRTGRRPESGHRPTSGGSLTNGSRAGGASQHMTDDLNSEAQLALAVEQDKAYAERQWYAPSAPSPRNIAEKAAAAVHDRWNDIDMEHDMHTRASQGRRSSFADYRVPAPSIGPGGEHHGYDFETEHELDKLSELNDAAAGSDDVPSGTPDAADTIRLADTNPAVTSQLAMPGSVGPSATGRPSSTSSTHRKPHFGPIHGTETRGMQCRARL